MKNYNTPSTLLMVLLADLACKNGEKFNLHNDYLSTEEMADEYIISFECKFDGIDCHGIITPNAGYTPTCGRESYIAPVIRVYRLDDLENSNIMDESGNILRVPNNIQPLFVMANNGAIAADMKYANDVLKQTEEDRNILKMFYMAAPLV